MSEPYDSSVTYSYIHTVNLVTTTGFVPKDVAIKMNLLLYRIFNEQMDM